MRPKKRAIVLLTLSIMLSRACVPSIALAAPMNEGVNQEAIPDVDIQYPDQDVATGPDYGSGDLIAFKVIDIPGETPDGEMSPASLRAACTTKPKCQVALKKVATTNGKCVIDFQCSLASMTSCVRIKSVSGSYTCKDTANGSSYRQSFYREQLVPGGGFTAYVDGNKEFDANHRIWVSWQFTAALFNYAYGDAGYSGTESL